MLHNSLFRVHSFGIMVGKEFISFLFFLQAPAGTRKLSKEEREKLRRLEQERKQREAEEER